MLTDFRFSRFCAMNLLIDWKPVKTKIDEMTGMILYIVWLLYNCETG